MIQTHLQLVQGQPHVMEIPLSMLSTQHVKSHMVLANIRVALLGSHFLWRGPMGQPRDALNGSVPRPKTLLWALPAAVSYERSAAILLVISPRGQLQPQRWDPFQAPIVVCPLPICGSCRSQDFDASASSRSSA